MYLYYCFLCYKKAYEPDVFPGYLTLILKTERMKKLCILYDKRRM